MASSGVLEVESSASVDVLAVKAAEAGKVRLRAGMRLGSRAVHFVAPASGACNLTRFHSVLQRTRSSAAARKSQTSARSTKIFAESSALRSSGRSQPLPEI